MKVKLFANLAEEAGQRVIELDIAEGATVDDALEAVIERHPILGDLILAEDGHLQGHINVLVNGTNVQHADEGLATPLAAEDEVAIFPPVSGG